MYPTVEEAQEALKYNGMAIRGQRLNVNMATVTQTSEGILVIIKIFVL